MVTQLSGEISSNVEQSHCGNETPAPAAPQQPTTRIQTDTLTVRLPNNVVVLIIRCEPRLHCGGSDDQRRGRLEHDIGKRPRPRQGTFWQRGVQFQVRNPF